MLTFGVEFLPPVLEVGSRRAQFGMVNFLTLVAEAIVESFCSGIFSAAKGARLELIASELEILDQMRTCSYDIGCEELDLRVEAFVNLFAKFTGAGYPELPTTRLTFEVA